MLVGIGTFADALAHALILRHTRNADFRALVARLGTQLLPEAELDPFDQGLYGCSEMLVDGFLALRRAGVLRRKVPAGQAGRLCHGIRDCRREEAGVQYGLSVLSMSRNCRGMLVLA